MQGLDSTIINTALPAIAKNLQEDPLRMHGVVVAYVLSVAACIPLSGWLAPFWGQKHLFFCHYHFSLASLGCAWAESLNELLIYRVFQGIGVPFTPGWPAGDVEDYPTNPVLGCHEPNEPGRTDPLIAPTLGGWMVEYMSVRWIFLINLPIGILGALITLKAMPNVLEPTVARFDFGGFILLIIAMVSLCLGIENFASPQHPLWWSLALILAGLVASLIYAYHSHTHQNALFRSKLFKNKIYSIGILGNFLRVWAVTRFHFYCL